MQFLQHVGGLSMLYRHGDVIIRKVRSLPEDAKKQRHLTLAEGEITGHSHRIKEQDVAMMFRAGNDLFLRVEAAIATVVHEEHAAIELPKGTYRVWRQREYTPERIVVVRD